MFIYLSTPTPGPFPFAFLTRMQTVKQSEIVEGTV